MPMLKSIVDELDKLSLTCYSQIEHGLQTSNIGVQAEISKSPSEHMPQVVLTYPLKVKTKGHPKTGNRLKSSLEISVSSQVKRIKCGLCGQLGHCINTCSLNKV